MDPLSLVETAYRQVLDHLEEGVLVVEGRDTVVYANRAACALLGLTTEQLTGRGRPDPGWGLRAEAGTPLTLTDLVTGPIHLDGSGPDVLPRVVSVHCTPDDVRWLVMRRSSVQGTPAPIHMISLIDVTERWLTQAKLAESMQYDSLTGLPNRKLLMDRIESALESRLAGDGSIAVMVCDLDNFKTVNDSLGHDAGDRVLTEAATRVARAVGSSDTVGRVGGDEFVICTRIGSDGDAARLAASVQKAVRQPVQVVGGDVATTVSIGIAVAHGPSSAASLLRDADAAMYIAKSRGPGTTVFFNDTMRGQAMTRMELERDLRDAILDSRVDLEFQPVVDLATSATVGAEALLRWDHPRHGPLDPDQFLDVAERSGLIVDLGALVLSAVCASLDQLGGIERVAVNVSPTELGRIGFVTDLRMMLDRFRLPADRFTFEITESVLLRGGAAALAALDALREMGARVAIDDFGTGYASLTYLKRFRVDEIKIDRTFVAGLGVDPDDLAIVSAVTQLAQALGLSVIAEGIETEQQAEMLRELGCERGQGYLFGRSVPLAEFGAHILS